MYDIIYHDQPLEKLAVLVTGGAGFIGSNLVEYLLKHGVGKVRVFDNLATGYRENLQPFENHPAFEFFEGDITNPNDCRKACEGITHISHQAALGSVPRSIADPMRSHEVNVTGFLNMLLAARDAGIKRFVYASSSSVYGDSAELPKVEERVGWPLSPYAVTKAANEQYARVFGKVYGMETIGLRYFNVFGPNQSPNGPYAAVIPLFIKAVLNEQSPVIHGDGEQTRDFTFVENAVQANVKALTTETKESFNTTFNIAIGERISLNTLWHSIGELNGAIKNPLYTETRSGDVRDSLADIHKANHLLDYQPKISVHEGLQLTLAWHKKRQH